MKTIDKGTPLEVASVLCENLTEVLTMLNKMTPSQLIDFLDSGQLEFYKTFVKNISGELLFRQQIFVDKNLIIVTVSLGKPVLMVN